MSRNSVSIRKLQGQAVGHHQAIQSGDDPVAVHPDQAGLGELRDLGVSVRAAPGWWRD